MDWNVEKRQQGKNFSLVGLFEEFIAQFSIGKISQISNKKDKSIQSFLIFRVFTQFLSQFRQTSRIEMLKTFTEVTTRCPVVFKDEIKSVF